MTTSNEPTQADLDALTQQIDDQVAKDKLELDKKTGDRGGLGPGVQGPYIPVAAPTVTHGGGDSNVTFTFSAEFMDELIGWCKKTITRFRDRRTLLVQLAGELLDPAELQSVKLHAAKLREALVNAGEFYANEIAYLADFLDKLQKSKDATLANEEHSVQQLKGIL
jgi:hypothetical protein